MLGLSEIQSVFRPGTKPISEILPGEVSKVDFIFKKSLSVLHIGDHKSFFGILFRRWVLVICYCSREKDLVSLL